MTAYPGLAQDDLQLYPYCNSGRQRVNDKRPVPGNVVYTRLLSKGVGKAGSRGLLASPSPKILDRE